MTVSQLWCCLLLFEPSIHLIQTAAGITFNGLFLFRGSHRRASGNVISGLKKEGKRGKKDTCNRETHRDTLRKVMCATELHRSWDSRVSPHGNHVFEKINNSAFKEKTVLKSYRTSAWVEEQAWYLLFPKHKPLRRDWTALEHVFRQTEGRGKK